MLPIWIKDRKTGKYDRIPYECMTRGANGEYIARFGCTVPELNKFFTKHSDHFEYYLNEDGWVFLGKKRNKLARMRHATAFIQSATTALTIILAINIHNPIFMFAMILCALASLFQMTLSHNRRKAK